MPRFHFNVYDGIDMPDETGSELPGRPQAREEAIRLAGGILRDDAKRIQIGQSWRMEVTDEGGAVLFRLDFHVSEDA